jgi:hypothetical protein
MARAHIKTISSAIRSEGENVSEIDRLADRVRAIGESLDWWNDKMVWALVLAAIAAFFVVLTTVMALKRGGQKDATQSELMKAKDRQLTIDLRDRDVKIAEAERVAAVANKAAEDEKLARVKIEGRLAWRHVDPKRFDEFVTRLKPFAGSTVVLDPIGGSNPEVEAFTEDLERLFPCCGLATATRRDSVSVRAYGRQMHNVKDEPSGTGCCRDNAEIPWVSNGVSSRATGCRAPGDWY